MQTARATEVTLTGDANVNSARPTTNYGGVSNLSVGSGTTALIPFDLTSLPASTTSSQIARASLHSNGNDPRLVQPHCSSGYQCRDCGHSEVGRRVPALSSTINDGYMAFSCN